MTVVALEREETDKVLYTALAKGADRAVKITGLDEDASSHTAAKAMCKVLGDMEYDVVLTGVQAADDRDGQMGVLIASHLGIPHVSVVSDIAVQGDKRNAAQGIRRRGDGRPSRLRRRFCSACRRRARRRATRR